MKHLKKILLGVLIIVLLLAGVYHIKKSDGIPILGYHAIVTDSEKKNKYPHYIYAQKVSTFKKQMQYLYKHHYKTLTIKEFDDYYHGKKTFQGNVVMLTFDDGYENFNTIVKPILKKYHMHATAFVIGKHLDHHVKGFLTRDEIKNDETATYYSHSYNMHKVEKGIDRKKIQDMTLHAIDEDFKKNGASHTYFAFPFGRTRQGITPILKENHVRLAFSYNQYHNASRHDDRYYLPRYMVVSLTPMIMFKWMVKR